MRVSCARTTRELHAGTTRGSCSSATRITHSLKTHMGACSQDSYSYCLEHSKHPIYLNKRHINKISSSRRGAPSDPEYSSSLANDWVPGKTLGIRKKLKFLIGCPVTACIVLPQKFCRIKFPVSQSLLATNPRFEPEDSSYEIGEGRLIKQRSHLSSLPDEGCYM